MPCSGTACRRRTSARRTLTTWTTRGGCAGPSVNWNARGITSRSRAPPPEPIPWSLETVFGAVSALPYPAPRFSRGVFASEPMKERR